VAECHLSGRRLRATHTTTDSRDVALLKKRRRNKGKVSKVNGKEEQPPANKEQYEEQRAWVGVALGVEVTVQEPQRSSSDGWKGGPTKKKLGE
jgi:hypothetical protein